MKHTILLSLSLLILSLYSCKSTEDDAFAYGNFESQDILISSEVMGELLSFSTEEGERLKKSDVIGLIDSTQLFLKKLQLISASSVIKSGLQELDAQIGVNSVNQNNLEREQLRSQNLLKDGAATAKQIDDMNGQIALIKAQTSALKAKKTGIYAQMESSEIQVRQIEDQIRKCFITAPIEGTVLEVYLRKGELAAPGKAIFKMANLNEMILRVFISGDQLSQVNTGDSIIVRIDGKDNSLKELTGEVIWISSEAEFTPKIIQTRKERVNLVYAMKVSVKNNGEIKIGMPGEVSLSK